MLHSSYYRQQLEANSTGATLANVNEMVLLNLQIPHHSIEQQRAHFAHMEAISALAREGAVKLTHQIAALQEHRQALITAAVTGQFDIPGAAA